MYAVILIPEPCWSVYEFVATLRLVGDISKLHTAPLSQWIADNVLFKFWGDNVDFKEGVCMFGPTTMGSCYTCIVSVLVGRSHTPATELSHTDCVSPLISLPAATFLLTPDDFSAVRKNLVVLVSRIITQYINALALFSKSVPQHNYSA